jgi:Sulfotransferase family
LATVTPDVRPQTERVSEFVNDPNRPLIIGACPRSGTTLLRTMLNSHPEIAVPRETRFVLESWERRKKFGDLRELENRRRLAHWIFKRKKSRWRVLGIDRDEAIERLLHAPPTLGSMVATCFVMYAEKDGKPRWGDKRPTYAARMRPIFDLFPHTQFVHVIRDPRACVASMRQLGWYVDNVPAALELWARCVRVARSWGRKLAPDQFLEVQYEELIREPQETLARIARYGGLASDAGAMNDMLRYYEHDERRNQRFHANVSRPLDEARISRWTHVLEPREIAFIERAAAPVMAKYGYAPVAEGVASPPELMKRFLALRWAKAGALTSVAAHDVVRKLITHRHPLAAEGVLKRGAA